MVRTPDFPRPHPSAGVMVSVLITFRAELCPGFLSFYSHQNELVKNFLTLVFCLAAFGLPSAKLRADIGCGFFLSRCHPRSQIAGNCSISSVA